jgi:hypothetical protein
LSDDAQIRTIEYVRPWVYPKQERAIFNDARYSFVEAGTKCGKTVGCILWLLEQAMRGREGFNYWWVAPIFPQAKIAFSRAKTMFPKEFYKANETEVSMTLINGVKVWFKSGEKPDNLYGEDVYAAVLDEASRMREDAWVAVRSTLTATRGKIRIIGNVKGRKNWFFKLSRKAEAGFANMEFHRITAADAVAAGVLDKDEIADARAVLSADVAKQLFDAVAADDEGNPFGSDAIRKGTRPGLSTLKAVCGGRDLAKSHDFNVGINLDVHGQVCAFERFQLPWELATQRIASFHDGIPTAVDSTGVGDPIVERLQKMPRGTFFEGYVYSSRSKQMIMENLAVMMQSGEISFPEGPIVSELESFEYQYTRTGVTYGAPEGMFDDCVNSLALAAFMKSKIPRAFAFSPITKVDSRDWRGQKDAILF